VVVVRFVVPVVVVDVCVLDVGSGVYEYRT